MRYLHGQSPCGQWWDTEHWFQGRFMIRPSLWNDENAATPVVGIILLVAITVLLAAVITTIVLGIGEDVDDPAPSASILFDTTGTHSDNITDSWGDEADDRASASDLKQLEITHAGGDNIDPENLYITGTESDGSLSNISREDRPWVDETFSTSDTIVVWVEDGKQVEVIWDGDGASYRLAAFET